jgi:hypothetical protein
MAMRIVSSMDLAGEKSRLCSDKTALFRVSLCAEYEAVLNAVGVDIQSLAVLPCGRAFAA